MRELQKEIIAYEHVLPEIDPKKEIRRSIDFLKDYLKANPFLKSYVLGISGGQDSTLTGKLCQMAIEEMREETGDDSYQFIAVRLPYGVQADAQDAADAVAFQKPDQDLIVNIKEPVDAMVKVVEATGQKITDFNKGNIKARQRMVVKKIVFVGSGLEKQDEKFKALNIPYIYGTEEENVIHAGLIGQLAENAVPVDPDKLLPRYLRRTQAEVDWHKKTGKPFEPDSHYVEEV